MINKESQTFQNLLAAFQGESMARNKYLFAVEQARKEGNEEIAALFETMAQNEAAHGKLLYQLAMGVTTTYENLQDAVGSENAEWSSMYPGFAAVARQEGYEDVAVIFERIAEIERDHSLQFAQALASYQQNRAERDSVPSSLLQNGVPAPGYRCTICGAVYPKEERVCAVCGHTDCFVPTVYYKFK